MGELKSSFMAAGHNELHSFVSIFVNLWLAGCEASLLLEIKAVNAFVNLKLGVLQSQTDHHPGGHRGGALPGNLEWKEQKLNAKQELLLNKL